MKVSSTQRRLGGSVLMAALLVSPVTADAQTNGFFDRLANQAAARVESFGQPTANRVAASGDQIASHLENHPEDLKNVDDIGRAVAGGTAGSLLEEARQIQGAVVGEAVRSVFGLFKPQRASTGTSVGTLGGPRSACAMISADEAKAVLRAGVRRQDFGTPDLCRYLTDAGAFVDVKTTWHTGQAPDVVPRMVRLGHCQGLPGLSKDACSRDMSSGASRVWMSRQFTVIQIDVRGVNVSSSAAARQLAGLVADRF